MVNFAVYRFEWLVALFLVFASICKLESNGIVNDRNAMTVTKSVRTKSNLAMSSNLAEDSDLLPGRLNITETIEVDDNIRILPRLTWRAGARSSVRVKESKRTCEEYMRLPPSEYSVLTAEEITRLSATEFKCTLPCMNFFGTKIQPVLYVDVTVYPDHNRSEIVVLRAETIGSETAERVNGTFNINAINIVSAGVDSKGRKTLTSDTQLLVNVEVPPSRFPLRIIQTGGNIILQASLDIIVPTFVRVLSADFQRWSDGNDTRTAVEDASF